MDSRIERVGHLDEVEHARLRKETTRDDPRLPEIAPRLPDQAGHAPSPPSAASAAAFRFAAPSNASPPGSPEAEVCDWTRQRVCQRACGVSGRHGGRSSGAEAVSEATSEASRRRLGGVSEAFWRCLGGVWEANLPRRVVWVELICIRKVPPRLEVEPKVVKGGDSLVRRILATQQRAAAWASASERVPRRFREGPESWRESQASQLDPPARSRPDLG